MKAKITWGGEVKFIAESESGHRIIMDGPPDYGGGNAGPRPMEMMLMGMGGCSAFAVAYKHLTLPTILRGVFVWVRAVAQT